MLDGDTERVSVYPTAQIATLLERPNGVNAMNDREHRENCDGVKIISVSELFKATLNFISIKAWGLHIRGL